MVADYQKYEDMDYQELEHRSQQVWAEIMELKEEYRQIARILDAKQVEELRMNPPDPGQLIGG